MLYEPLKRLMDITSAIGVALLFSPLLILIAIAIKVDSKGPIIFKHRRVGKDGKIFYMWKFRSMVENANSVDFAKNKDFINKFKKKEGWKLEASEDPRITRVGRFTRKYSFDELPNLWNIFIGDMSIVGPRAYRRDSFGDEVEQQLALYKEKADLREKLKIAQSVKPGLTGPWQVGGRNKLPWDRRVELDAEYAQNKNILQDLFILMKTPFAMLNKW